MPDLVARPLSPAVLAALIERRPRLVRPLAAQLLPPAQPEGLAARLGIGPRSVRNEADRRQAAARIATALARDAATPAEAARLARSMS